MALDRCHLEAGRNQMIQLYTDQAPTPGSSRWLSTMAKRSGCRPGLNVPVAPEPEKMLAGFEKYRRYIEIALSMLER